MRFHHQSAVSRESGPIKELHSAEDYLGLAAPALLPGVELVSGGGGEGDVVDQVLHGLLHKLDHLRHHHPSTTAAVEKNN